jgi:hypothetical protein
MLAAALAAVLGSGQSVRAQYGPMGGQAGPYGDMMAPTAMPMGMGMMAPGGMPGPSPYAPPAFAPAAYAGIGGPAPMGGMGGGAMMAPMDMQGMPSAPASYGGGGGYCAPGGGCGWTNHYFAFGEFLYLRPRNAEVAYAVPIDSAAAAAGTQVQLGAVQVADPDYAPAFRAGFGAVLSPRSAISVSYTQFDRDTFDTFALPGTGAVFRSLVQNPNPLAAGGDGLLTAATLQTQFQIIDGDYKGLFWDNGEAQLAFVVGARYANLEQHFAAGYAPATGFEEVLVESEFDGGGLKFGLDGMRMHPTTQFFFYGKGSTSFVAGTFRNRYVFNSPTLAASTNTTFEVGRLVTMLDLEAGLGWQNFTGNLRFSMGYMISAWYNTVRVNEFINSVQTNNFADPSDNFNGMISFDGLTAKVELLW